MVEDFNCKYLIAVSPIKLLACLYLLRTFIVELCNVELLFYLCFEIFMSQWLTDCMEKLKKKNKQI